MPSWAPLSLVGLLLAAATRHAAAPVTDPDTFWHLRLGHEILERRSIDSPADWAASGGQTWVLTQWVPEAVLAKAVDWFGLPAVAWLFGLGLVVLTLIIYRLCRCQAGLVPAAFVTAMSIVGMAASLSPRPHMVTYIFLAISVGAWVRSSVDLRPRWWLVPLTWLWANSHGMWFTGVVTGLAVVIGLALDGHATRARLGRLAAIPLLSIVAAGLTPVGPDLLLAPFAVGDISGFVTEWQPPSFRSTGPMATAAMIALVAVTWSRLRDRISWARVLLLLLAAGWTLLAARTVTLGAIIVAPLAASAVQGWLRREPEPLKPGEFRSLLGAGAACLVVLALVVPRTSAQPAGVPSALNTQLDALPSDTLVLNAYEVGGWLRWRHPTIAPYIDGLTEAYSRERLEAYARLVSVSRGWDDVVEQSGATYAILPQGSPLATALAERLSWVETGSDAGYVLLRNQLP